MIVPFLRVLPFLLVCSGGVFAEGNNWMTPLDGALSISRLSIPGTHNSGATIEKLSGTAKCQNLTIGQQLDAGVRFLDIRCRHMNDGFTIYHGSVNQNLRFTEVLDVTLGFLTANPGETVIMSVKEAHKSENNTRGFEATFDSYVARDAAKWLLASDIPTLDAARGKIVLFRRFGASTLPKGMDASNWPDNTSFRIEDRLRVQDRYMVSDTNTKWAAILELFQEADHSKQATLYVNFLSGYKRGALGIPNITAVSNDINRRLEPFFADHPHGRFGVVVMDFADAAKAALIYGTNKSAGRPVR